MSQDYDWLNVEPPKDHLAKTLQRSSEQLNSNRKKSRQKKLIGFFASLSFVALVAFVFTNQVSVLNTHPQSLAVMSEISQLGSSEDIELMASSDLDFEDLEDLQVIESLDQGV